MAAAAAAVEKTFLRFILEASYEQVKLILKEITSRQLQALGEVCMNLVHGSLSQELLNKLKRFQRLIRQLANKSLSVKKRKTLVFKQYKKVIEILRISQEIFP